MEPDVSYSLAGWYFFSGRPRGRRYKKWPIASPELATATIVRATADADAVTSGLGIEHGTLDKADKLIVVPAVALAPMTDQVPPEPLAADTPLVSVPATKPLIVSRHWHDPTAPVMAGKSSPTLGKSKQHKQ
jgi:hypothetical protein